MSNPDTVHVFATIIAQPGKADEVRTALVGLVEATRAEAGTVLYQLHEDTKNEGQFHFFEIYEDKASLGLHAKSNTMKSTFEKIGTLLASPPVIVQTKLVAER